MYINVVCAPTEESDQPTHPHSLIRTIDGDVLWVVKGSTFLHVEIITL